MLSTRPLASDASGRLGCLCQLGPCCARGRLRTPRPSHRRRSVVARPLCRAAKREVGLWHHVCMRERRRGQRVGLIWRARLGVCMWSNGVQVAGPCYHSSFNIACDQ